MIISWDQLQDAPVGSYVGISHPDGRKLLTSDHTDPIIKTQRRINRIKADHSADWEQHVNPADLDLIAAWLDTHGNVNPPPRPDPLYDVVAQQHNANIARGQTRGLNP